MMRNAAVAALRRLADNRFAFNSIPMRHRAPK
jgi:hypothetical protein